MNTRIAYLYRDASNYKSFNAAIVSGELTKTQINEISSCLEDSEYFIPSQIGLPENRFEEWTEDDHVWFEMEEITPTEDSPTITLTATELFANFRAAKDNWRESERYKELSCLSEDYETQESFSQTKHSEVRGQIIQIDGHPYELRLPTGGQTDTSEWDEILDCLSHLERNPLHLDEGIFSLCADTLKMNENNCICRGGSFPEEQSDCPKVSSLFINGYRPILIPLNEHSLEIDREYLDSWMNGSPFEMGTLYMGTSALRNPQNPVLIGGDIPNYSSGAKLEIRNSSNNPSEHIRWIKTKNCLIADRNLLANISWEELNKQGLVMGFNTTQQTKLSSLDDRIKAALEKSARELDLPAGFEKKLWNDIKKTIDPHIR